MKRAVYRKLKIGTVIAIPLDEAHVAFGQVIEPGIEFYLCVYQPIFPSGLPIPELAGSPIALVGWTTDELLSHERWFIAGQQKSATNLPRPYHVICTPQGLTLRDFDGADVSAATEADLAFYGYRYSVSNIMFERAMRDIHGLASYDRDYTRITHDHVQKRSRLNGCGAAA